MSRVSRRSTLRLFIWSAALSLIPVVLLAVVLAESYRSEAKRRGLAEARSEATLVADTAIEPLLSGTPLSRAMPAATTAKLDQLTTSAVDGHRVLRLRLRALDGKIVYPQTPGTPAEEPDDEVLDAAHGEIVSVLTHENADRGDEGPVGVSAVEVYLPLKAGTASQPVGVLELYLPYAPIQADVAGGLHQLLRDALLCLGALWVLLLALSWSVSRGLRRQVARNKFLAEHDALTELPNRTLFLSHIKTAVEEAANDGTARTIAIIDVDRFKEVNDSLGHHNGDAILVELARRLVTEVGHRGTVARLGGDEFGLVLDDATDPIGQLCRVRATISQEIEIQQLPITLEASVGYVIAPDDGESAAELLQRADVALYVAKEHHSGVVRYDATHDIYDSDDLALLTELRRGIAADELVLNFQPKADLRDGRFASVEALVRWQHPTRGLLPPDRFLPLAERTDLVEDLTDWVLARAATEILALSTRPEINVAVNVSARSLSRPDFPDRVMRALNEAGVDPRRLTIEITETTLMSDPKHAALALSQLDAFGVKISLDDFGTGQTSLGYLSSLPIDELKIDKSFVASMLVDDACAAIVRSVIELGHNLGFRVVAEGIEQTEVFDALREAGCDEGQGFLMARPMPLADLGRFLRLTPAYDVVPAGSTTDTLH